MHVIENVARKMDMRENKETRLENTNKSIQIQSQSINIQQNLERSNDVHCMVRDCMANPRGSVVDTAPLMGKVGSPITVPALKNTSGLVQAATARRIWVVRKDSPTWYAARMIISILNHYTAGFGISQFIQPNPSRGINLKSIP